jgi:hypothetical protein
LREREREREKESWWLSLVTLSGIVVYGLRKEEERDQLYQREGNRGGYDCRLEHLKCLGNLIFSLFIANN